MTTRLRMLAAGAGLAAAFALLPGAKAEDTASIPSPRVDLAIALDVSGSMSDLIDSAKQRLWDIVNELGQATPAPELRVAILSYGSPRYGIHTGFVRVDQPFTSDLDAVNRTLFAFQTDGGDEYVARVVERSVHALEWSADPGALRVIFVAGNESAAQDPQIPLDLAAVHALERGIVVNTLYCGSPNDPDAIGWRHFASRAGGLYASIDKRAGALATVSTPMDEELLELNRALNDTYVSYGRLGEEYRANQIEQDANAEAMSPSAAASRTVTKGGALYDSAHWDILDALDSGVRLEALAEAELPAEMQPMSGAERRDFIAAQREKRERIVARIATLARDRQSYIEARREASDSASAPGLEEAIRAGLRELARRKGFTFEGR